MGTVLKLDSTRSEALQVISDLKLYHEVVHISYERTLIDSLQKLYKNNKAQRDSCGIVALYCTPGTDLASDCTCGG